jgi:hypothetical protein
MKIVPFPGSEPASKFEELVHPCTDWHTVFAVIRRMPKIWFRTCSSSYILNGMNWKKWRNYDPG